MANWVSTYLTVTGDPEEVARFKAICVKEGTETDQESLLPKPGELGFDFKAIIATPDGNEPDGDWAEEHWGVGCNAFDFEVVHDEPGRYECRFFTKWCAPEKVFERMPEVLLNLTIEIYGYDLSWPVPNFAFKGKIENGKLEGLHEADPYSAFRHGCIEHPDGSDWVVKDEFGKELGEFQTEREAEEFLNRSEIQERLIAELRAAA